MAFTGTAVIKQVNDNLVRITGVSLVDGDSGTIGLFEKTSAPNVRLPAGFMPRPYSRPDDEGVPVSLADSVSVLVNTVAPGSSAVPIGVAKSGTTPEDFVITLDATTGGETDTGNLEIYLRFH